MQCAFQIVYLLSELTTQDHHGGSPRNADKTKDFPSLCHVVSNTLFVTRLPKYPLQVRKMACGFVKFN